MMLNSEAVWNVGWTLWSICQKGGGASMRNVVNRGKRHQTNPPVWEKPKASHRLEWNLDQEVLVSALSGQTFGPQKAGF